MTPADLAKHSAISFEAKKDSLRQMQNGDWKVAFTVQAIDMDERITRAAMGTRFIAVLVEVDDLEMPVHQPAKESSATPEVVQDKPPLPAKRKEWTEANRREWRNLPGRMDWRELQPAAQAGIRCADPVFWKFLSERQRVAVGHEEAPDIVRFICGVKSRSELGTNHKARVLWHQLDSQFLAWKHVDA